jgi:hypothetical protein
MSYAPITESRTITRLGGIIYRPCGKRTVILRVKNIAGQVISLKITDIYYIPKYNINLLLLVLFLDKRINTHFKNKNIILQASNHIFTTNRQGNVWFLDIF